MANKKTNALVSNLILGQGPWTPWQMFAWGSMGYLVGILVRSGLIKGRLILSFLGFFLGILFGWVMNLWFLQKTLSR